jgi:hypothetical protein
MLVLASYSVAVDLSIPLVLALPRSPPLHTESSELDVSSQHNHGNTTQEGYNLP